MTRTVRALRRGAMAGRGAPAAEFSPIDITGLQLWLKADALALANAAVVASWTDSSGLGNSATQATESNKPTFKTNIINGKPVVWFDRANDNMVSVASASTKPFTAFAAIRLTAVTGSNTILASTAAGGMDWRISLTSHNLVKQDQVMIGTATDDIVAGVWYIIAVSYSVSGDWAFYRDGVLKGTGTNDQTFVNASTRVGAKGIFFELFGGDMAEIIKFDSALSVPDLNRVGNYLETKYALTWMGI